MTRPTATDGYRGATKVFSVVIMVFGVIIVVRTLAAGGGIGAFGLWIGLLFTALGAGRFYLATRV